MRSVLGRERIGPVAREKGHWVDARAPEPEGSWE